MGLDHIQLCENWEIFENESKNDNLFLFQPNTKAKYSSASEISAGPSKRHLLKTKRTSFSASSSVHSSIGQPSHAGLYTHIARQVSLGVHASSSWNPYRKRDVPIIERIQRRATKLVPSLKNLDYAERLHHLRLTTHGSSEGLATTSLITTVVSLNSTYQPTTASQCP